MAFPPYLQTDSQAINYGLTNQLSPEAALKEQALNRRRAIANLLVQQGITPGPGGKMVGRFYVADSPLQGAANLAKSAAGLYLLHGADKDQEQVAKDDQQSVVDAIKNYQAQKLQREQLANAPVGVEAQASPPQSPMPEPQAAPPAAPPQGEPEPFRGIAPRPDGPYQGEVGAVAMPETGVQSSAPPIPAPIRDPIAGQEMMRGLDFNNSTPADMSQFAQPSAPATPAQPLPSPAPAPTPTQLPPPRGAMPQDPYAGLAELMTHQHPQVRAYGNFLANQIQHQQAAQLQREYMQNENNLNRDVRREGIAATAASQAATLQNTMAMKEMSLAQMEREGLRDAAAKQRHDDLLKSMNEDRNKMVELQAKMASSDRRYQSDTLKAVAGIAAQGKKDVAAMKAGEGRPLPGSIGQKFIDNSSNLRQAERALALAQGKEVEGVKGDKEATGMKGYLPDAILQRTDPAGVDTRAAIANLGSMVIHDRSGAAVTAAEFPRLRPFIPHAGDDPAVVQKKLGQFVNEYKKVVDEMGDFYKESGYHVPDNFHRSPEGPGPTAPAGNGAAPPSVNSKGWTLHQDAKGNKAYVSPDGKSFEEVR